MPLAPSCLALTCQLNKTILKEVLLIAQAIPQNFLLGCRELQACGGVGGVGGGAGAGAGGVSEGQQQVSDEAGGGGGGSVQVEAPLIEAA